MAHPPEALTTVAGRVEAQLAELLHAERSHWSVLDPALDEPLGDLADMTSGGGKRIRPAYCYWGWVLAGGEELPQSRTLHPTSARRHPDDQSQPRHDTDGHDPDAEDHSSKPPHARARNHPADAAGCALELLHAFALVHDDVMDASPTRRGAPSVWRGFVERHRRRGWRGEDRRFGEAAAVLTGNMALILADRALGLPGPVPAAARAVWDTMRTELNMGQYLDIVGTARSVANAAQARTIIEHKTALYSVVRPLQLGAALTGRTDLADELDRHGRLVGTAFQLRDDLLGTFGNPTSTGKPVGEDIREGKPTLLMALARASATPAQLDTLSSTAADMDDDTLAKAQQVLIDTGARAAVEKEIDELLDRALDALEDLPDIGNARDALADLAHYAIRRQS